MTLFRYTLLSNHVLR